MKKTFDVYRKRTVTLWNIIEVENWLNDMALNGCSLVEIRGRTFCFSKTESQYCRHFLQKPESGTTNSDAWIFYEFAQKFGTRIHCSGNSLFSPRLSLVVGEDQVCQNADLISFYYDYRNYRLSRRLLRNFILAILFFLIAASMSVLGDWRDLITLLPYTVASGGLSIYFGISLFYFLRSCNANKWMTPLKKPKRPGY